MAAQEDGARPQNRDADQRAPLLSVTVLNYNYGKYLPQCLDSILRQTFTDFELILVNDCSTDDSLEVIEPYLADPRVRLVNHAENQGYIASLIEGSRLSQGKYIMVISADDYCVSDSAFENLLQPMEADDGVAFAYSAYGHYEDNGIRTWLSSRQMGPRVQSGAEEYRDLLVQGNYILHSGVIIRKTAYKAVGGYDPSARYACDTIMWLMLCGQGKVAFCADELFAYRQHGSNMSISTRGIRKGLQESLGGINTSFSLMRQLPGISHALYVRGLKRSLSGFAEVTIFSGHIGTGWYAYWCALRIHPILTVFQIKTPILIARTLLGSHGYQRMRSLLHRNRRPAVFA